jgi:transcriptional regulator with XRE-family HTH domain
MSMRAFGERLKALIRDSGSSQKELAVKLGKDDQTISRWVTGHTFPDALDIEKMCKILGIKASELFGESALPDKITPEILKAIDDPIALKALLATFQSSTDIKNAIKTMLSCLPALSPEKRQAILSLCK